jgi:hypothetical protein
VLRTAYVGLVAAVGTAVFMATLPTLNPDNLGTIAFLALLCLVAQRMPISLFSSSSVSVAVAFAWCGFLLAGPAAAVLVNVPSILFHGLYPTRRPTYKVLFNLGLASTAAGTAGLVFIMVGGQSPVTNYAGSVLPMLLAVVWYFCVQSGGVAFVIRLSDGGSFLSIWRSNYRDLLANYLAMGGVSLGMALAFQLLGIIGLLVFSLPLVMAWQSFRLYTAKSEEARTRTEQLLEADRQIIESMRHTIRAVLGEREKPVDQSIDDPTLASRLAARTARRLGLEPELVRTVEMASLLHDVGLGGVSDSLKAKQSPLTSHELELVYQHPVVAARIVEEIGTMTALAETILYHHERVDGEGFPRGLAGQAVPVTSQVLAVVDAYHSLTAERQNRTPLSSDAALREISQRAGSQFDPSVVEAFATACRAELAEQGWLQRSAEGRDRPGVSIRESRLVDIPVEA